MPQLQNPQLAAERSDPLRGIGRSSRRTEPVPRANRADGSLAGAEVLAWPDPARASSAPPIPTGHRIRSLGSPETARATDSPCHRLSMPQTPHATDPHATSRAQHRPRRVEEQTRRGRAMDRRLSRRLEQSRSARVVVARQHYSDRTRLGFWVSAREHFPYPPPPGGVPSEGRAGSRSNTDECPLRPYRPLRSERDRDRTRRRSGGRLDGRDVDSPDSQHHAE